MTETIGHLSHSSISTYGLCARSWKFRYIDLIPAPKSPALVFGSAMHNTIEEFVAAKAVGAERSLIPLWHEMWTSQLETEIDWQDETPESMSNLGVRILSNEQVLATLSDVVPMIVDDAPVIEKYVTLQVPGVPVPVIGYIDMIAVDGVPCDFKTSSRAWYPDKAQAEIQPLVYLAALMQEQFNVDGLKFRYYIFTKTKTPQAQVIEVQHSIEELLWMFEMVREVWHAISARAFPPNPQTWKCGEKWCEYWNICRGGAL